MIRFDTASRTLVAIDILGLGLDIQLQSGLEQHAEYQSRADKKSDKHASTTERLQEETMEPLGLSLAELFTQPVVVFVFVSMLVAYITL